MVRRGLSSSLSVYLSPCHIFYNLGSSSSGACTVGMPCPLILSERKPLVPLPESYNKHKSWRRRPCICMQERSQWKALFLFSSSRASFCGKVVVRWRGNGFSAASHDLVRYPGLEEWLDRARRSDHCCCCTSQPLTIKILSDSINFLRVQTIHHLRWEHTIFFDLYFRCVLRSILSLTFMPSLFRRSPCRCSSVQTAHTAGIIICGSNK